MNIYIARVSINGGVAWAKAIPVIDTVAYPTIYKKTPWTAACYFDDADRIGVVGSFLGKLEVGQEDEGAIEKVSPEKTVSAFFALLDETNGSILRLETGFSTTQHIGATHRIQLATDIAWDACQKRFLVTTVDYIFNTNTATITSPSSTATLYALKQMRGKSIRYDLTRVLEFGIGQVDWRRFVKTGVVGNSAKFLGIRAADYGVLGGAEEAKKIREREIPKW